MKKKGKILVVDDNEEILIAFRLFLSDYFEEVVTGKNPNHIPALIQNTSFDLYILDMNFNAGRNTGNEGLYWMKQIKNYDPEAVVIFITAYGDIELSVNAIKQGATDFIQKPWDDDKLLGTILSAYELRKSRKEIIKLKSRQQQLQESLADKYEFFVGKSDAMKKIWKTIEKVSSTDANILILGESGTGKELIAREIHRLSPRSTECFVKVDVGALSETLFESELFGHKKGAFTDAKENRKGRFEMANEGTLFLDEIGNIPIRLQSKLLTVLQNHEIQAIGSNSIVPLDIRLISATNLNLAEFTKQGLFREDLLYRINTIQIEIPPLRERLEDIPDLLIRFLDKYKCKYQKPALKSSKKIVEKLQKHNWPGNIREFEHIVEKAVILCEKDFLHENDIGFPGIITEAKASLKLLENEILLIQKAIKKSKGNFSLAAEELGVSRKTLYNKIKKYGL
jgi:DNA-binding NtrC family response regulator